MKVEFSYLQRQFADREKIWRALEDVVKRGDFTLGEEVKKFEERIAARCGTKYAVGTNSGTDALLLSLKVLGLKEGDEVITVPNTFVATVGAIVTAGGKPVFVDVNDEYLMDVNKLEEAITPRTRGILPVHYSGAPCDMDEILDLAEEHDLFVVEDACQAVDASYNGRKVGSFGDAAGFSLHPLKNLNVWGDGGFITTNSKELYEDLCLWRNHGLLNRNVCKFYAYNGRISTVQATVALHLLDELDFITETRNEHAEFYDKVFKDVPQLTIPPRRANKKQVYHLYILQAERRDELLSYLQENGVDAKIHYPIPLHLQPASEFLGYKKGDFPVCEKQVASIISLPLHQHLANEERQYVADKVREFYKKR